MGEGEWANASAGSRAQNCNDDQNDPNYDKMYASKHGSDHGGGSKRVVSSIGGAWGPMTDSPEWQHYYDY